MKKKLYLCSKLMGCSWSKYWHWLVMMAIGYWRCPAPMNGFACDDVNILINILNDYPSWTEHVFCDLCKKKHTYLYLKLAPTHGAVLWGDSELAHFWHTLRDRGWCVTYHPFLKAILILKYVLYSQWLLATSWNGKVACHRYMWEASAGKLRLDNKVTR